MNSPDQGSAKNLLLKALPPAAFHRLAAGFRPVELQRHQVLVEPDVPTETVIFIEAGFASIIAVDDEGQELAGGHIGREGLVGKHILLGAERTATKTVMNIAGEGFEVHASVIHDIQADDEVRQLFLRYVHSCEMQFVQSALANARYSVSRRLARWILMCHDRANGDVLHITHEYLSHMLAVRRPSITTEMHLLEGERAIKSTRGVVRVIDRQRLEAIADGCYGMPEREYERLIGQTLRRRQ